MKNANTKGKGAKDMSIVFFDIDGTFLSDLTHKIPDSAVRALQKLQSNGHLAFINTGRTYVSIPDEIKGCGFDGYICGCGTYVYYKGQQLTENKIPEKQCIQTIEKMREWKQPVVYEENEAIYFEKEYEIENEELLHVREYMEKRGITKILPADIRKHPVCFDKLFVHLPHNRYEEKTRAFLEKNYACIDRGNNAIEAVQKEHSKATGIRFICDYLNVKRSDSYAFGDSMNDLEMLQEVTHAVAMGVCDKRILKCCEYQTDTVEQDGIWKGLKYFGLI